MDITNAIQLPSGLWGAPTDIAAVAAKDKVKALVISDSHFNRAIVNSILLSEKDADILLFCGDGIGDIIDSAANLPRVVAFVRGNNDPASYPFAYSERVELLKIPRVVSFSIADCPVIMTHGDGFSFFDPTEDSIEMAQMNGAQVILSGHTHRGLVAVKRGVLSLNPGSVSRPRGSPASFAVLDFERGKKLPDYTFYKLATGTNTFFYRPFTPREFVDDWLAT